MSELEKMARAYCDETGSWCFEYEDASNELIDAYESAWNHQQKKIEGLELQIMERVSEHRETKTKLLKVKANLANWNHAVESRKKIQDLEAKLEKAVEACNDLLFHCEDYGVKEESLAILMACEKASKTLEELGEDLD